MLKHLIGKEDFEGIDRFFQAGLKFDPSEIRFAFRRPDRHQRHQLQAGQGGTHGACG